MLADLVVLIDNCSKCMDDQSKNRLYTDYPEIFYQLVFLLSSPILDSFIAVLDILGEAFALNEELCSRIVQTQSFNFLQRLQKTVIYGDMDHKIRALWLTNNIVCNSLQDCITLTQSGLLSNTVLSADSTDIKVRKQAMFCVQSILRVLQDHSHGSLITQIALDYQLEAMLLR